MSLRYGLFLPQGFLLELAGIKDPVEAIVIFGWCERIAKREGTLGQY